LPVCLFNIRISGKIALYVNVGHSERIEMLGGQRYISSELTHFVGRGKPEEEQYSLLCQILTSGQLRHPEFDPHQEGFSWHLGAGRISDNEMYSPAVVCFCDIPVADLDIHMAKYSRFGIAFAKSFLLTKGATPVFYVAKDALGHALGLRPPRKGDRDPAQLATVFDNGVGMFNHSTEAMMKLLVEKTQELKGSGKNPSDETKLFSGEMTLTNELLMRMFLSLHVLSYVKFFDGSKSVDDADNYYMEREWRALRSVEFTLADVERVILPRSFAKRFRADLPEYEAQITFV